MYIEIEEITTHLFPEQVLEIGGDENVTEAIEAAIEEARGYLTRYDVDAEFAKTGSERNKMLVNFIKDIAIWHYINICNLNTDLDLRLKRYELAKAELVKIQKGDIIPKLPVITNSETGEETNTTPFLVGSNPKRGNHI